MPRRWHALPGIFNNNQQFKDAVDVTEVYRLSDTTNIDVNRQNAKAYCMLKEYGTAVKRYESLKDWVIVVFSLFTI